MIWIGGPPFSKSGYDLTPLTSEEVGSMVDKLTELQKTVLVQVRGGSNCFVCLFLALPCRVKVPAVVLVRYALFFVDTLDLRLTIFLTVFGCSGVYHALLLDFQHVSSEYKMKKKNRYMWRKSRFALYQVYDVRRTIYIYIYFFLPILTLVLLCAGTSPLTRRSFIFGYHVNGRFQPPLCGGVLVLA